MFKGIHYGEEVWMDYVNEGESALKQVVDALNKANLEFELLPIYHKSDIYHENLLIDVLKYRNNGEDKYYIISGLKGCYLVTRRLPDDMDLPKLVYDLLGQKKGKAPMVINSKFKSLFDQNMLEAQDIISEANGIFDKNEKYVITIFKAKAEDAMPDEDKKVDEWLFDDKNPVEEYAMFLYLYKEKLQNQHDRAAADGDLKQICAEPCGGDAQHQRGKARDGGACGVYNGREGHDGQRHIRHVEQKRAQEAVADGPADERQRQLADEERHGGADQNIQINFTVHPDFPPSAPARPSPGKAAPLPTQLKSSAKSSACPRTAS